jgi:hypothetical protein
MTPWRAAAVGVLALAAGLTGCGGGRATYVTQVPQWNYQVYKRIAVLPPKVPDPRAAREAELLTDRLTTLLTGNGAFTVLSRSELKDVFKEQDLSKLVDAASEDQALPEGKIEIAQALVAAKITDYKLIADKEERSRPVYQTDRRGRVLLDRGGRPIVAGEEVVTIYRHGAEVEGSVRVIDAATGKILLSHSARVAPKPRTGYNRPPRETPEELAGDAMQELAVEFYKQVAPTRTKVKLKGDMLIVATEYYDGRYSDTKSLPTSCADFLLVVRDLPPECDRNQFRVTITEEEGRVNLFEQEFVWSGSAGAEGVCYKVPLEALTKTGGDRFVAKLYSGGDPEPILTRGFKLEVPKVKAAK